MSYLTPTTALGAGLTCFGLGVTRRVDTGFKALGAALCALAFSASPAFADQFVEAADNAKIDCVLSRGELTRATAASSGPCSRRRLAEGFKARLTLS